MRQPLKNSSSGYTWDDYQSWHDGKRWELIDGTAFDMSPAPSVPHQDIAGEIYSQFKSQLRGKNCRAYIAPVDVKLSDSSIVQPDAFIVCDRNKIKTSHIDGAPDLIAEVLSPWTTRHDRMRKTELYARHGVKELWLVTPAPPLIELLILRDGKYQLETTFGDDGFLASPTCPGLRIDLAAVFDYSPIADEPPLRFLKDSSDPYALMEEAKTKF